ncbi:protein FAM162B [Melanotaenia boesemani]|uniref:protein FAM162B n=1 Tax=Melanotaenia boesemani TaxID=1250792 RepID=UPI001C043798|nr:protein FAM162B [Melanotaenia boesemani]
MAFLRSRIFTDALFGQRYRGMCNKLQETKSESAPAAPAQAPRPSFKVPGYRPTEMDKKIFIWSGRFKSVDQIPEVVSFEMIDAARNKLRVKAAYFMMAATIGACLLMVILGKRAAGRHESLTSHNMEKKARWREELQRDKDTVTVSEK